MNKLLNADMSVNFLCEGFFQPTIYSDALDTDKYPEHLEMKIREVNRNDTSRANLVKVEGYAVNFY